MKRVAATPGHSSAGGTGTAATRHTRAADSSAAVDEFMRALEHPYKREIEAIRRTILQAAPGIAEGIKWSAPSFRTHEYFATINLREKGGVGVILHLGARIRAADPSRLQVADPAALLRWLAPDRALVRFEGLQAVEAKREVFADLIRTWVTKL